MRVSIFGFINRPLGSIVFVHVLELVVYTVYIRFRQLGDRYLPEFYEEYIMENGTDLTSTLFTFSFITV